jgi:hypothetical protein
LTRFVNRRYDSADSSKSVIDKEVDMRTLLAVVVLIAAARIGLGEDSGQPRQSFKSPRGMWTRTCDDGSNITLSVEEKTVSWVAEMPEKGTTRMTCPAYHVSEEGVLFGYMDEVWWTNGVEQRSIKQLFPFAFRFQVDSDKLVMTELKLFGADEKAHKEFMGNYRKAVREGGQSRAKEIPTVR